MDNRAREIIEKLIEIEGGKVDDPIDRGGRTNFGITQTTLDYLGHSKTDPFNLTLKEAMDIYHRAYYLANKYDKIDSSKIAYRIMNIAIHTSSPGCSRTANKMLQRAYNDFTTDSIETDGIIGPITLEAINTYSYPISITQSLIIQQGAYYRKIVRNNPSQRRFKRGWFNRLEIGV